MKYNLSKLLLESSRLKQPPRSPLISFNGSRLMQVCKSPWSNGWDIPRPSRGSFGWRDPGANMHVVIFLQVCLLSCLFRMFLRLNHFIICGFFFVSWDVFFCISGDFLCLQSTSKMSNDRFILLDDFFVHGVTHLKFNIAPEKRWLEDYFPNGKVSFQGLCWTLGGFSFEVGRGHPKCQWPTGGFDFWAKNIQPSTSALHCYPGAKKIPS